LRDNIPKRNIVKRSAFVHAGDSQRESMDFLQKLTGTWRGTYNYDPVAGIPQLAPVPFTLVLKQDQNNPDGITWRVKQVLGRALAQMAVGEGRLLPAVSPDETRSRGLAYIDGPHQRQRGCVPCSPPTWTDRGSRR
jgi:hypothetical protein